MTSTVSFSRICCFPAIFIVDVMYFWKSSLRLQKTIIILQVTRSRYICWCFLLNAPEILVMPLPSCQIKFAVFLLNLCNRLLHTILRRNMIWINPGFDLTGATYPLLAKNNWFSRTEHWIKSHYMIKITSTDTSGNRCNPGWAGSNIQSWPICAGNRVIDTKKLTEY